VATAPTLLDQIPERGAELLLAAARNARREEAAERWVGPAVALGEAGAALFVEVRGRVVVGPR
jgi:hypothetical protein